MIQALTSGGIRFGHLATGSKRDIHTHVGTLWKSGQVSKEHLGASVLEISFVHLYFHHLAPFTVDKPDCTYYNNVVYQLAFEYQ